MSSTRRANPGPSWGYRAILFFNTYLPAPLFDVILRIGVFIGLIFMPKQRKFSAEHFKTIKGKTASIQDIFNHFYAFAQNLILKLKADRNILPKFYLDNTEQDQQFIEFCNSNQPALFGTFHVGYSDILGCMLEEFNRKIRMLRIKVDNSLDTQILKNKFSDSLEFLWVDKSENFIFQLKDAVGAGESIAIQCDRVEGASKVEKFLFLKNEYLFPMTIYHLSSLFQLPVLFSFTGPIEKENKAKAIVSPIFYPSENRKETLAKGKLHFRLVLDQLEAHLNEHPELWFNFTSLKLANES